MSTFEVQIMRTIVHSVRVEAGNPASAVALVDRADYPLPENAEWSTLKGDEYSVYDAHGEELDYRGERR